MSCCMALGVQGDTGRYCGQGIGRYVLYVCSSAYPLGCRLDPGVLLGGDTWCCPGKDGEAFHHHTLYSIALIC